MRSTEPGDIRRSVRAQEAVRGGWGLTLLLCPDLVVSRLGAAPPDARTRAVARILGGRHVAQAVITVVVPNRRVLRWGGLADLAHAASGLALAAVDATYRRAALTDATIASGFGVRGLHAANRSHPPATAFSKGRIS